MTTHQAAYLPNGGGAFGASRTKTWPPLALALVCAASTYGFLVWPYQQAEAQGFALSHGAHAWLFEHSGPGASFLASGALISVVLAPFVATCVAAWAATWAWLDWRELRRLDRALLFAGSATAAAVVTVHFSPLGRDVARWWIG